MQQERRQNRSDEKYRALGLQFGEWCDQRSGQQVVLVDADGLILSRVGNERQCEAMGAQVAEKYRSEPSANRREWRFFENLATLEFYDGIRQYFLGVLNYQSRREQLPALAQSVERIFKRPLLGAQG